MGTGPARLTLVGTPIGNLDDLSPRVAEVFAAADVVACEDTRRTGRLLSHLAVRAPRLENPARLSRSSVAATQITLGRSNAHG